MTALLPVEEAQRRIFAIRAPLSPQNSAFSESLGRYLSDDVTASRDQPAAALSAMDGYAIRFGDLPGPWRITGEVAAGSAPTHALGAGEAIRIFTGALLPEGADTVVIQEDVATDGTMLTLTRDGPAALGGHIRGRAGDFAAGAILAEAGMRVTPGVIAAAIMGGAAQLPVRARPRVAILTTGNELVQAGRPLAPGQIPDSNGAMLFAMLAAAPAVTTIPLHARDDREKLAKIIKELARRHDVIVTVGGASVGDHDHVRAALDDAGGTLDFWKVAMKPGKPLIAGRVGEAVLLGLPGNPASAFVAAALFLLPLVRHLAGARDPLPAIRRAPLAAPLGPGGTRRDYLRARFDGESLALFDSQDSGRTVPLATADALVIREAGAPPCAPGEPAQFIDVA